MLQIRASHKFKEEMPNSVDPNEMRHCEPSRVDLSFVVFAFVKLSVWVFRNEQK